MVRDYEANCCFHTKEARNNVQKELDIDNRYSAAKSPIGDSYCLEEFSTGSDFDCD